VAEIVGNLTGYHENTNGKGAFFRWVAISNMRWTALRQAIWL
jgi:hypothetical protein